MPPGCQNRRAIGSGKPLWKLPHRWKKAIRYAAFYHRCLEKWENDFSTATTAATAAQFKNRTSHTFWRRPKIGGGGRTWASPSYFRRGQGVVITSSQTDGPVM